MIDDLIPYRVYKISKIADEPALRGQLVTFYGWLDRPWDIRRAVVRLINRDGSAGDEWLVARSIIIPL